MIQTALPLDWPADEADDSFLTTPSNAAAVRHLDSIGTWPVWTSLLVGPRKSGRSLLGRIFARRTGGTLIDNADRADERMLFNAWNEAQGVRRPLLMIADAAPPDWSITLPDLRSRIAASPIVAIGEPDDLLIARLLAVLLERRGLVMTAEAEAYLIPRAPRSHIGVIALVDALDSLLLARKGGRITVPVARSALEPAIDRAAKAV